MSRNHRTKIVKRGLFGNYTLSFVCSCCKAGTPVRSPEKAEAMAKRHRDTAPRR
ncbi:hypothetical protein [Streptomyces sp. NPDC054940]